MLYFIKSLNYLKIGYTKDADTYNKRLSTYRTHNPDFKVLDVVEEGNENDEIKLHHLLKQHSYYTEWFYDCPEVYEVWEEYTKNMTKYVPEQKRKENIIKLKKSFIITDKNKGIKEDIDKIFNKENCIMSGNEIKEKMSEIYSYYGVKFYPNIKTLEKYGYLLTRFLDIDTFKYKIEKILV